MSAVLLDTSAVFAIVDLSDSSHLEARQYLDHHPTTYVVPHTVFSETVTLVKVRLGPDAAVEVGTALVSGDPFRIHYLTIEEVSESWGIFCRFADKEWSYTDCSLLALGRQLGLGEVFSFDHHFDQMAGLGLRRVP